MLKLIKKPIKKQLGYSGKISKKGMIVKFSTSLVDSLNQLLYVQNAKVNIIIDLNLLGKSRNFDPFFSISLPIPSFT